MTGIIVRVQHHPSRAMLLPRLLERLGDLPVEIVPDPKPRAPRNAFRTYQACLEPDPAGRTLLILQDDVILAPGFDIAAPRALAAKEGDLVSFYLGGLPALSGSDYDKAMKRGARFVAHNWRDWAPVVALAWPPNRAAEMREFVAGRQWGATTDDSAVGLYARKYQRVIWHTIPSIVQHPDDVPGVGNGRAAQAGRNAARVARHYTGDDAALIEWA